jgi:hypothetical protein
MQLTRFQESMLKIMPHIETVKKTHHNMKGISDCGSRAAGL